MCPLSNLQPLTAAWSPSAGAGPSPRALLQASSTTYTHTLFCFSSPVCCWVPPVPGADGHIWCLSVAPRPLKLEPLSRRLLCSLLQHPPCPTSLQLPGPTWALSCSAQLQSDGTLPRGQTTHPPTCTTQQCGCQRPDTGLLDRVHPV